MATIIQPYNPWREQLAANILGPIIGDAIQRSQEANQNRKYNALIAKTMSDLGATGSQGGLMSSPAIPEGYNDNGWAKAFHENYTPFTQFDMGTASIAPTQTQPQSSVPDTQAFRNALMANMGTKRFSMLNPAFVEQNMTPFYQSMEQARQEAMKKQAADAYMNAPDGQGKFDQLIKGMIPGYVDPNILTGFEKFYEYNNPHKQPYKFDTGATTQYGSFNPSSGEYSQSGEYLNSLSPSQSAELGLRRDEMNREDARYYYGAGQAQNQFDATMANNDYWKNIEQRNWADTFNAGRKDAEINQGFEERRIGAIEQANEQNARASRLKELESAYKSLQEQEEQLRDDIANTQDKREQNTLAQEINDIRAQKQQILNETMAISKGRNSPFVGENQETQTFGGNNTPFEDSELIGNSKVSSPTRYVDISGWKYGDIIQKIAQQYGIDPELIQAIIFAESAEKPNAISHAGAKGLMQLMDGTAQRWGVKNPFDPAQNILGGVRNMDWLLKRYKGDISKALWGYNAGSGNVDKGRMPNETAQYIPKVMFKYHELKSRSKKSAPNINRQAVFAENSATGETFTKQQYEAMVREAEKGTLENAREKPQVL